MPAATGIIVLCLVGTLLPQAARSEGDAILRVKRMNSSWLDRALPDKPFSEWLEDLTGREAETSWEVNDCGEQTGSAADRGRVFPMCVGVEAKLRDGRKLVILIAVGTSKRGSEGTAEVFAVLIREGRKTTDIPHLPDLEPAIKRH